MKILFFQYAVYGATWHFDWDQSRKLKKVTDPLGQLTRRLHGFSEELFLYDEAANLPGHQQQVAFNNQVTTSDAFDYTYDGFGRIALGGIETFCFQGIIYDVA